MTGVVIPGNNCLSAVSVLTAFCLHHSSDSSLVFSLDAFTVFRFSNNHNSVIPFGCFKYQVRVRSLENMILDLIKQGCSQYLSDK